MRSLVISVLLYACETWTLTGNILKKLQATEMSVRNRIGQVIGPYDDVLTTVN